MRVILMGCEYTGKTTLAKGIARVITEGMGDPLPMHQFGWHDHFVLPFSSSSIGEADEDAEQVLAMKPSLLEKFSRYLTYYHFQHVIYTDNHHLLTNWYYGDAVYAPIYYGYGAPGGFADRHAMARLLDAEVMRVMPDMVLVQMTAGAETIHRRMVEGRHEYCFLKEEDVELLLGRFREEFSRSLIRRKFTLDTTDSTPEEALHAFMMQMKTHLHTRDLMALQGYYE